MKRQIPVQALSTFFFSSIASSHFSFALIAPDRTCPTADSVQLNLNNKLAYFIFCKQSCTIRVQRWPTTLREVHVFTTYIPPISIIINRRNHGGGDALIGLIKSRFSNLRISKDPPPIGIVQRDVFPD